MTPVNDHVEIWHYDLQDQWKLREKFNPGLKKQYS